jgi:phospholipase/carboxylesterase
MADLSFVHAHAPGDPARAPLLLLHGTGGNEHDLVPFVAEIAPGRAFVSPRGKGLETGMPRFFRRCAEGVFDGADVRARAGELAAFVAEARDAYGLAAPVAVGFSNGANIAAAMLYLHPQALAGAVLWRAMTPLSTPPEGRLDGARVLIASGRADPIVPAADAATLAAALTGAGAQVTHEILPTGHGLVRQDLELARAFLA